MDNKYRFSRIIENFINDSRGDVINYIFGYGSKVKIKNIDYSITSKLIYIDATVILGGDIDEDMLNSNEIISELIKECMEYISPDEKLAITVTYDV